MKTSVFDDQSIDITCLNCDQNTPKEVSWIKANNNFACACGANTSLKSEQFLEKLAEAEKLVEEFSEFINNIKL